MGERNKIRTKFPEAEVCLEHQMNCQEASAASYRVGDSVGHEVRKVRGWWGHESSLCIPLKAIGKTWAFTVNRVRS